MARFRAWWVSLAFVSCGGENLGVYRHSDGPPVQSDAGAPAAPASDAGTPACGEDTGIDWESPLSCAGLDGCKVSRIQLVAADGAHAFGIASSADGSQHAAWERAIDRQGNILSTALVPELRLVGDVSADPDWLQVRELPDTGRVFALAGPVTGQSANSYAYATWWKADSGRTIRGATMLAGLGDPRTFPGDFVVANDAASSIEAALDQNDNVYWGRGGPACPLAGPAEGCTLHAVWLAAAQSGGTAYWYGTDTDDATLSQPHPLPGYPRFGDFVAAVDVSGETIHWQAKLEVHTIVKMRTDEAGNVFVAGTVGQDVDVRAFRPDGSVLSTARHGSNRDLGLALAADGLGGAIVAWNESDGFGNRAASLERFDSTGARCAEIRLAGVVTDLAIRPDGRVVVATSRSTLQIRL